MFNLSTSRPTTAGTAATFVSLDSPRRGFFKSLSNNNNRGGSQTSSPRSRPCSGATVPPAVPSLGLLTKPMEKATKPKPPFGQASPRLSNFTGREVLPVPPFNPPAQYPTGIESSFNVRDELDKFTRAMEKGFTLTKPPVHYKLLNFLFRKNLALYTSIFKRIEAMGQEKTLSRFKELGTKDCRLNSDEFYYIICDMFHLTTLPREETNRLFESFDWNGSGIVDSDEIEIGMNVFFQNQPGSIAVFTKKSLDSRAPTQSLISLFESECMLLSVVGLCDGRYRNIDNDVEAVMSRLRFLARDGMVPLEWLQEFVLSDAPIIAKVLNEMPDDGSMPTPAALGRFPSPDPERDIKGIHATLEAKKTEVAASSSDPEVKFSIAQETLENPRFRADTFLSPSQKNGGDIAEHYKVLYYSLNGAVYKKFENGVPEIVLL